MTTRRLSARDAAKIFHVSRSTIYKWAREGRITRYEDGFDQAELLEAEASRDLNALLIRAGKSKTEREELSQRLSRHAEQGV